MTCRHAAELISRELDTELSIHQRARLGLHSLVCGTCRRFRWQLAAVHESVERYFATTDAELRGIVLPSDSKELLKAAILFHLNSDS